MITFSCSCGKKYQLPDRVIGREVRCNQCGKALIVPNVSQTEELKQDITPSNNKKNEPSPLVSDISDLPTEQYQKRSFSILTIVLILTSAGVSFFAGFLTVSLLHQVKIEPPSHIVTDNEKISKPVQEAVNEVKEYTVTDWKIGENPLMLFTVKTIDGVQIQLSLDGNPVAADEKKTTLDDIADALTTETEKSKDSQEHHQSLRIHSESGNVFRFIWPSQGSANLDGGKFKTIHFSLYIPNKDNDIFKPGKPEGTDKTLVLSALGVRFVTEIGYIEFVPESIEKFVSICDRAQSGWVSVQIPIFGDEIWKRTDHGTFGSQTVQRIELYAQPTGSGAMLWIANLGIGE